MIEKILNFFYPASIYCIACGNLIDSTRPYSLCDECMHEIKWITDNSCRICGKSLGTAGGVKGVCFECREISHEFTKGFSCTTYEGPVKEILSGLKYKGRSYYAKNMIEIMRDRACGFINDIKVDMMIPVPMYKKKERARGYNQSYLLAQGLSRVFDIPCSEDMLIKDKETQPMSSLNSGERRINLHNAFRMGYNEDMIIGKNILMIDDVYTTGSTADACAQVLKENGAEDVYVFTFTSGVNMKSRKD